LADRSISTLQKFPNNKHDERKIAPPHKNIWNEARLGTARNSVKHCNAAAQQIFFDFLHNDKDHNNVNARHFADRPTLHNACYGYGCA
jgi:hypothetical protein